MFAAWGRFVFHRKWWVLAASVMLLAGIAGAGFRLGGELRNTSHVHFESQRATDLMALAALLVPMACYVYGALRLDWTFNELSALFFVGALAAGVFGGLGLTRTVIG